MGNVRIKETLNRPREYTIINTAGKETSLRFDAKQAIDVDERLITGEMLKNIDMGSLLVLSGNVPKAPNPYPLKGNAPVTEKKKLSPIKEEKKEEKKVGDA